MMFLYLPHSRFGIKNRFGKELWCIDKPEGSQEWQAPRWSNRREYCAAVAKYGDGYKLCIIKIPTSELVVLRELAGDWQAAHLWLPSGAAVNTHDAPLRDPRLSGIATTNQAEEAFAEAAEMPDARQARAVYLEVAETFADEDVGRRAQAVLDSPAFQREVSAAPHLAGLWALADRLRPVAGTASRYDAPAYFARNQALLIRMAHLVRALRSEYAGTRTAQHAVSLAATYALPDEPPPLLSEQVEVVATIEAVSRVPTVQQIAPYREAVTFILYSVDRVVSGKYEPSRMVVVHWGMRDGKHTPAASWRVGRRQQLTADLFDSHPELDRITQASGANDPALVPYWCLEANPEASK